jgi:hypothetical protein
MYSATLESYTSKTKSRHSCPSCGAKHEFTRYKDSETGEYIADHVGRCNRDLKCGYHYTPKQFFDENPDRKETGNRWNVPDKPPEIKPERPIDYLPFNLMEQSMKSYEQNNFHLSLTSLFGTTLAEALAETYCVGTSKHWPGANIFWQMDINGRLRQAKVMLYDSNTLRRVKNPGKDYVYFAGKKIIAIDEANLQQCFFGEVQLRERPTDKIAIVESEKTAMIASVYFPELIWLATGGSHGCKWTTREVAQVLTGRQIILFPDLGFYDKWLAKAEQVRAIVNCEITVSDLLELEANDEQRAAGWDLADYLLLNRDAAGWALTSEDYPLFWDR